MRLCANVGCHLHLIEPVAFSLEERRLRRAGLDYREFANVSVHPALDECLTTCAPDNVWAFSSKASCRFTDVVYAPGDVLLFGPETRGLPEDLRRRFADTAVTLPMHPGNRSLNLSNAVAVAAYEAWRQQGFAGAASG